MSDALPSLGSLTLAEFSQHLASAAPVPGGGSASAVTGSMAAALLAMVARLSLGRPKYEAYQRTNERALEFGDRARRRLLELANEDAHAYGGLAAALKLPKESDEQAQMRAAAMRAAAREASEVPLVTIRECARLLEEIGAVVGRSNVNAASDLEVAGRLCAAAARGAAANVQINLPMVGDARYTGATVAEINYLLQEVDRTVAEIAQGVGHGGLREPEQA